MPAHFPPGGTVRRRRRGIRLDLVDNRWRESAYLLREIQRAVDPSPGLASSVCQWRKIEKRLRASHRWRWTQMEELDALGIVDALS